MQPINISKLIAKNKNVDSQSNATPSVSATETIPNTRASDAINSAMANKQRLAIGLLLKQTLQNLSSIDLLMINSQKALLSAKKILPGEFTQLYIQSRVQQHKLTELLNSQSSQPQPLRQKTINQWFSGQLLQTIVYQQTKNNIAQLLLHPSGQLSNKLLAELHEPQKNQSFIKQMQVVNIKTDLTLSRGQQLLLQINKTPSEISFQLPHSPVESNKISQFINQLSSKQQALPQLMASLQSIVSTAGPVSRIFSAEFIQQARMMLQQFPRLAQLNSASEIKTALYNSGNYMESKLLHSINGQQAITETTLKSSQTSVANDLKAALSQLLAQLQTEHNKAPSHLNSNPQSHIYKNIAQDSLAHSDSVLTFRPVFNLPNNIIHAQVQNISPDSSIFQLNNLHLLQSRIIEQLEGALSRISINQLHNREAGDQSFINFELPFRHNDRQEILQLKIRQQSTHQDSQREDKIWTVNLAFHLSSLGAIRIYIIMEKQELSMQFWTEKKSSQHLFQNYFPLLNERLLASGFSIAQLSAFHGMPEQAEQEQQNQQNQQFIIDERV